MDKIKIVAGALLGILILIILAKFISPPIIEISELEDDEEKEVRIQGNILKVTERPKVTFLEVQDSSGKIDVVLFEPVSVSKQDLIEVTGKVQIYKNKKELIAEQIKLLN